MIRPITCLAFLLACGSGLYLYQSKHRVKVLDDQIAQTVKSTDALREQTRMLSAEWTLLNDPERLRQLATQFLTLQTVSPNQFTSLADLDSRLPPPVPPGAPADAGAAARSAPVPVASDGPTRTGEDDGKPAAAKTVEAPPPASAKEASPPPARIATSVPAEHKLPVPRSASPMSAASQPPATAQRDTEPHGSEPRVAEQHGSEQRVAEPYGSEPRVAETRPTVPAPRASAPVPVPQAGGSLLGMAHGTAAPPTPVPLPRPVPMNAAQWSYASGG